MRRRRGKDVAMAMLAGCGAALTVLSMPVGFIEMLVASSGMSETLPAAAPPLGLTARLLIAAFAGLMAVCIAWVVVGMKTEDGPVDGRAKGDSKMGFALSKLTALARGRSTSGGSWRSAPALRRADAHPDAPARAPIFASRDFDGLDIFNTATPAPSVISQPDACEPAETVAHAADLDMPRAPEPLAEAELPVPVFAAPAAAPIGPGFASSFASAEQEAPAPLRQATPPEPVDPRPITSLSISELTERLERGLTNRRALSPPRVIADMPVAERVAVKPAVEPDLDEALRAALGTLRTLTARAG